MGLSLHSAIRIVDGCGVRVLARGNLEELLRTGQCTLAGASIGAMLSAFGFSNYTAFCYLIASMGLQTLWSFGLLCLDIYDLKFKIDLHILCCLTKNPKDLTVSAQSKVDVSVMCVGLLDLVEHGSAWLTWSAILKYGCVSNSDCLTCGGMLFSRFLLLMFDDDQPSLPGLITA
ncbi:hypothetical protein OPV22_025440 [Ensete ventricosum]|uniref:CASP-like protein n=1 Tax=Ensete ventricosum TaxID=4639 RepID=A0AAV8Q7U9_ENSVE|nr:hypothetical protein OPV22_025440 [Ensete ventricosum]